LAIALVSDGVPAANDLSETTYKHREIRDSLVEDYVFLELEAYSRLQKYVVASLMRQNETGSLDAAKVFRRDSDGSITVFVKSEMAGFQV
jgi:hypothetical protein